MKIWEWINIQIAKRPGRIVLLAVFLFNIVFTVLSAIVISSFKLEGTAGMIFIDAAFYTITMLLDPGCISFVVTDIGQLGLFISVFCLAVVVIGMISFTGAIIGYVTNYISSFIEEANAGSRKLYISDHVVILNWNSRAAEII